MFSSLAARETFVGNQILLPERKKMLLNQVKKKICFPGANFAFETNVFQLSHIRRNNSPPISNRRRQSSEPIRIQGKSKRGKNTYEQVTIRLGFTSDWLKSGGSFFTNQKTQQCKTKANVLIRITFDFQLKSAKVIPSIHP